MNPLSVPLNDAQQAAVSHDRGHLMIVAGPGAGKTRTLTSRIQRLTAKLAPGEKILAITFTNRAAGELRERLISLGVDLERRVEAATFHAFALTLLRRYEARLPFPQAFSIATPAEIEALAVILWPDITAGERRQRLRKVADWKASLELTPKAPDVDAFVRFLREQKRVDFDDILRDAVLLLRDQADIREDLHRCYRYICVDEYQDMNPIQEEFLRCLAGEGVLLTVIGDPDQAIYGFRGSDAAIMEHFPSIFTPCKVMSLSVNYRSGASIVSAATAMISKGARGAHAATPAAGTTKEGEVRCYLAPTVKAEASYVARAITRLVGGSGFDAREKGSLEACCGFGDIAVLYRLNAQADVLAQAFAEEGVPFRVAGPKAEPGGPEDIYEHRAEKVSLMTLHASKGLEFDAVFIVGADRGLLPLEMAAFPADKEEERRLFYVGMTRARKWLCLVSSRARMLWGESLPAGPSLFLDDIPDAFKTIEHPRPEPHRRTEARQQMKLW